MDKQIDFSFAHALNVCRSVGKIEATAGRMVEAFSAIVGEWVALDGPQPVDGYESTSGQCVGYMRHLQASVSDKTELNQLLSMFRTALTRLTKGDERWDGLRLTVKQSTKHKPDRLVVVAKDVKAELSAEEKLSKALAGLVAEFGASVVAGAVVANEDVAAVFSAAWAKAKKAA